MPYTFNRPFSSLRYRVWFLILALILFYILLIPFYFLTKDNLEYFYRAHPVLTSYFPNICSIGMMGCILVAGYFVGTSGIWVKKRKEEELLFSKKYPSHSFSNSKNHVFYSFVYIFVSFSGIVLISKSLEPGFFIMFSLFTVISWGSMGFLITAREMKGLEKINQLLPDTHLNLIQGHSFSLWEKFFRTRKKLDVSFKGTYRGKPVSYSYEAQHFGHILTFEVLGSQPVSEPGFILREKKPKENYIEASSIGEAFEKCFVCNVSSEIFTENFKKACLNFPYFLNIEVSPVSFRYVIRGNSLKYGQQAPFATLKGQVLFFDSLLELSESFKNQI